MPMMAMTTSSSIKVKPPLARFVFNRELLLSFPVILNTDSRLLFFVMMIDSGIIQLFEANRRSLFEPGIVRGIGITGKTVLHGRAQDIFVLPLFDFGMSVRIRKSTGFAVPR